MKINQIQQTPCFKGYKNLICDMYEEPNHAKFAFMSLQLTNDRVSDLEDWKTIQKELYGIKKPKDIITFQLLERANERNFYLADKPLTMKIVKKSTKEEKLALRAHSLIASLTRRILEQSMTTADNEMPRVLSETVNNIRSFILSSIDETSSIIYQSFNKKVSDHKIAETINKSIQKNMRAYFK